jgi:FMN phosphatase YigB (HAD superfamily)
METKRRIGVAFWDVDNSLMNTTDVIFPAMSAAVAYLCQCSAFPEGLEDKFHIYQTNVRKVHHVNPQTIWPLTIEALRDEYCFTEEQGVKAIQIIMDLYQVLPPLYPGIVEALTEISDMNYEQGVVTHAEPDWNDFKLKGHGLIRFFKHMTIADVRRAKTYEDWKRAKTHHCVTDEDLVWAMGDNIKGDIIAALEAGIQNVIFLDFSPGNALTRNADLPREAHTAKHPSEVPLILRQFGGEGGI